MELLGAEPEGARMMEAEDEGGTVLTEPTSYEDDWKVADASLATHQLGVQLPLQVRVADEDGEALAGVQLPLPPAERIELRIAEAAAVHRRRLAGDVSVDCNAGAAAAGRGVDAGAGAVGVVLKPGGVGRPGELRRATHVQASGHDQARVSATVATHAHGEVVVGRGCDAGGFEAQHGVRP